MPAPALVAFCLFGAFAVADWVAVGTGNRRLEYVCKPAALAALVFVPVLLAPDRTTDTLQVVCFTAALVCSLAGDVFLMLPSDRFVPGLASFLLGHVFYIVGLNAVGLDVWWPVAVAVLVGLALALVVGRVVIAGASGRERGAVIAYMSVITVMVVSAWVSPWRTGVPGAAAAAAFAGATLFYASDAMIGWRRFVEEFPGSRMLVIITYHLGQAGLVLFLWR